MTSTKRNFHAYLQICAVSPSRQVPYPSPSAIWRACFVWRRPARRCISENTCEAMILTWLSPSWSVASSMHRRHPLRERLNEYAFAAVTNYTVVTDFCVPRASVNTLPRPVTMRNYWHSSSDRLSRTRFASIRLNTLSHLKRLP